jgi:hypothetical protein
MRTLVAGLAALLLIAGPAGALTQSEKQRQHAKRSAQKVGGVSNGHAVPRRGEGYGQYRADKMPFGSLAWWEQMRREGRLGGETP